MIITRGREHTVNMGNYESLKISATVTVDSADPKFQDMPTGQVNEFCEEILTNMLTQDIEEARALTNVRDSYILSWKA